MDNTFYIRFDSNWFNKKDIINMEQLSININNSNICYKLKVLNKPRRKWYHLLLQRVTFGLYIARWTYKVKHIK